MNRVIIFHNFRKFMKNIEKVRRNGYHKGMIYLLLLMKSSKNGVPPSDKGGAKGKGSTLFFTCESFLAPLSALTPNGVGG